MDIDPCTMDGAWPFDHVTITPLHRSDGKPNGLVEILGERQGGERSVRIPYDRLWDQMETHMTSNHGKSLGDVTSFEELGHATIRAAVVFLID